MQWPADGSVLSAEDPSAAESSAYQRVSEILTKLEERSNGLKCIRCKVRFVEDDRINLSKGIKEGRILFLAGSGQDTAVRRTAAVRRNSAVGTTAAKPNPYFLIHFDRIEKDGVRGRQEWYLFDGRWLYLGMERIRQVTKQEIARPGERIDLFDLERAPFPLPFGQKKETILRNFDVTLLPPTLHDPPNTDHLVCIPKPGSRMERKYDKLELFVLRDLHLPSRIVVTRNGGLEINTADFPDLSSKSINAGLKKKDFKPPAIWKRDNYEVVVERLAPQEAPTP